MKFMRITSYIGITVFFLIFSFPIHARVSENVQNRVATMAAVVSQMRNTRAWIERVTLSSKGINTIVVATTEGGTVTVTIDRNTVLLRRYWGKATLDELQIGDVLSVYGKWMDDSKTTVTAGLIRDWSIQKRNGVFFGKVLSVTDKGWVIETKRGDETVTSSGAAVVNRRGERIMKADVMVGHWLRVKGVWNRTANTITEVSQVKDYSLPLKTTASPTGTR